MFLYVLELGCHNPKHSSCIYAGGAVGGVSLSQYLPLLLFPLIFFLLLFILVISWVYLRLLNSFTAAKIHQTVAAITYYLQFIIRRSIIA